jgi:hypothetical protein
LHDLRHFYASGLIASGCGVVTAQRALEHASVTTTLSTYWHLWPSAGDRTRATAQSPLGEPWGLGNYDRSLTSGSRPAHTLERNVPSVVESSVSTSDLAADLRFCHRP